MRKAFPLSIVLLALTACGPTKDKEPNDDLSQATPARPGKVTGTLSGPGDTDVFKLDVAKDGAVLSGHVGGIRGADFVLSVRGPDRQELKRYDETGTGGDEEILDVGLPRGTCYVVLSNKDPQAGPGQEYSLELRLAYGPGREREPNESVQSATPLEAPGVTRGHYYPSRNLISGDTDYLEADWFSIAATQPGLQLLNLDLGGVPQVDPVLEVYDESGYRVKTVDSGGTGEGESLRGFGLRAPARYFLRLLPKQRSAYAAAPYEILSELLPYEGRAEFEPNDQRPDATPLTGESITGTVAPEGDADWYKLAVDAEARFILRAAVTGVEGLDLRLELRDSLGAPLVSADNMGKGQPETLSGYGVRKGEYYLVVGEASGRKADGRQAYTLSRSLVPYQDGLEFEVNDSTAAAQPLKLGESVDGYLDPKGDADVYEFNVYQKGRVVFELAGVLNVQFKASLLDQDYREQGSWSASKPGESLSFEKELEPGTYALRLSASSPEQNNVRDKYSLRLKVR